MTKKITTDSVKNCQNEYDEMLAPSLRRFVKMVKSNEKHQHSHKVKARNNQGGCAESTLVFPEFTLY